MNLEVDGEFWSSLNLISTQADVEPADDQLHSILRKSPSQSCQVVVNKSLPITSIISRIQAEESGSDDEQQVQTYPPPSHTGGKWKPSVDRPDVASPHSAFACENEVTVDEGRSDEEVEIPHLTCTICSKVFSKLDNLIVHLTSDKHRARINADNARVAAQLYTRYHSELVKKSAYQCCCCQFAANNHSDLIIHIKSQQHKENVSQLAAPMECLICKFLDYEGDMMLTHCLSDEHREKASQHSVILKERRSQIKCQLCSKVLHSTFHFRRHLKTHKKPSTPTDQLVNCLYCEFKGKQSSIHQHVSRIHRNGRVHICLDCESSYHSKYELHKHKRTRKHVERVLDSFKKVISYHDDMVNDGVSSKRTMHCHFCVFTTSDLHDLQTHYADRHKDDSVEDTIQNKSTHCVCRYCSKQLSTSMELYVHELQHVQKYLATKERTDVCFICGEKVDALEYHQLQHNPFTNKKPTKEVLKNSLSTSVQSYHVCPISGCNKSYKYKGDLTVHMTSHTGERSHNCDKCEKSFATRKQLKAHSVSHSSVTPFSCDYCPYKCKTRCHLQRHMRIHAGSKPYSCPYCQYSCTSIGNLRKHILESSKHAGLPVYECTERGCTYVCDRVDIMSKHLMTSHDSHCKLMVKSTENDWTEIHEGHSIIQAQHS